MSPPRYFRSLHLGELLEERVVLLEALLGGLEHRLRLLRADLLHELLEAVLAEFLRDRVLRERDRVGLVGRPPDSRSSGMSKISCRPKAYRLQREFERQILCSSCW